MIVKNLTIACCTALMAFGLAACGGGTDGGTDAGTTSIPPDASTNQPPPDAGQTDPCHGTCTADQVCDASLAVPACVSICNNGNGCDKAADGVPLEICNPTTKACEPVSCGGTMCDEGELCYSTTQYKPDPSGQCYCHPAYSLTSGQKFTDTCAPYGKVCDWGGVPPTKAPADWKCVPPKEYQTCLPTVGCETGFDCIDYSGKGNFLCLKKCAGAADSSACNTTDVCLAPLQNHCFPNICGVKAQNDDPTLYFAGCDANTYLSTAGTTGTCLPFQNGFAMCITGGSVASGGKCDPDATRADPTKLCPVGEQCVTVQPDPADPTKKQGECRPICNAAPKNMFCTQNTDCAATGGACNVATNTCTCTDDAQCGGTAGKTDVCKSGTCTIPARVPDKNCANATDYCLNATGDDWEVAQFGLCEPGCNGLTGAPACTGQDSYGNTLGCQVELINGSGYCVGERPTAGDVDQACAETVSGDPRLRCKGSMLCDAKGTQDKTDDTCTKFCDTSVCSTGSCATCNAGTGGTTPYACKQFDAQNPVTLGYCSP